MKYIVVEPFTLETSQGTVTLPTGKVLELSRDQTARLAGKVELMPHPNGGRDLPHYCEPAACHCSSKLPDSSYPAECLRFNCEHYQTTQQPPLSAT